MAEIRLRPFEPADSEALSLWYGRDPQGLEAMMGTPLPDPLACTLAFNDILQRHAERRSIFLMAVCDDRAIGCVIVSDLPPEWDKGRPHIYILPDERRHSFAVARVGERVAARTCEPVVEASGLFAAPGSDDAGGSPTSPSSAFFLDERLATRR